MASNLGLAPIPAWVTLGKSVEGMGVGQTSWGFGPCSPSSELDSGLWPLPCLISRSEQRVHPGYLSRTLHFWPFIVGGCGPGREVGQQKQTDVMVVVEMITVALSDHQDRDLSSGGWPSPGTDSSGQPLGRGRLPTRTPNAGAAVRNTSAAKDKSQGDTESAGGVRATPGQGWAGGGQFWSSL